MPFVNDHKRNLNSLFCLRRSLGMNVISATVASTHTFENFFIYYSLYVIFCAMQMFQNCMEIKSHFIKRWYRHGTAFQCFVCFFKAIFWTFIEKPTDIHVRFRNWKWWQPYWINNRVIFSANVFFGHFCTHMCDKKLALVNSYRHRRKRNAIFHVFIKGTKHDVSS